tara:strand:- start:600 stop:773 length:174 start_codon:yes stop_codon:yes gene_type:complete
MTYSELLVQLLQLNAEQLRQDVTLYDIHSDEHYPMKEFVYTTDAQNVLDTDYPILSF